MVSAKLSKLGWSLLPVLAAALLSLGLLPSRASAQSPGDNASVADAARRAREQKKNAAKPARTLTNDDLPATPAAVQQPAAPAGATESTAADQARSEDEAAETAIPADGGKKKKA
jgi:hypothetical protein